MNPLLWALVTIALATFTVETAFVEVVTSKAMLKRGLLTKEFRLLAYFWLLVGYPADFVFNITRGMAMFRTLRPCGWLFSARIDYYMRNPQACKKLDTAVRWAALLNVLDPGHTYWPAWARKRAIELGLIVDMISPTPEQIDALAFDLHTMGVNLPAQDTAFFQAIVRKWIAQVSA